MTRTNLFLSQYPPGSHDWSGKVTLVFSHPIAGWIQFGVMATPYVQNWVINFSNVYDPVPGVIQWLEDIVDNNLPCECGIDEEGKVKALRATPVNDDEFIFEILAPWWNKKRLSEQPIYLYMQVNRHQFLSEFLKRWDDFLDNYYEPKQWEEYGFRLREMDISKIRKFVDGQ